MHGYLTAHKMGPVACRWQLQDEVVEHHGVVVAHHPFVARREHQLQLSSPASLTKALCGCAGVTVKRRLKSGMKTGSR
jgi:hypothetical protein